MDSTKKIVKTLAGHITGTAAWATNVANERGQILMSVLTASEGVGLQPMVAGLMKRYLDGVYSHLKFSMLIVTAVEVQQ